MERLGRLYSYFTGSSGQAAVAARPASSLPHEDAGVIRIQVTPFVAPALSQALATPGPPAQPQAPEFVAIDIRDAQGADVGAERIIGHEHRPANPPPPPGDHVAIDIHEAPEQPPESDDESDDEAGEPRGPVRIHASPDHRKPAYQRDVMRHTTRADGQRYKAFANDRADIELGNIPLRARHRTLRQRFQQCEADIKRLEALAPITPEQTRATAWRVGGQLALRDGISQAVGRVCGLAATAGMRVAASGGELAMRNVAISGAVALVAASAVFGSRMSELLVKGFDIRDRRALVDAAFLVTPLLLQAGLPLVGAYCGPAGTGVKLLATVVGRLVAALGRDGFTQCQTGLWSATKLVRPDGKPVNLDKVITEFDRYRLQMAFVRYTISSLLLLVGGRALLECWIKSDGSNSFHDLMYTGMTTVIPSVLNEAFDGLNGTLAQGSAATASGLALEYAPAPGCMSGDSPPLWERANRTRSHAGARMVFGTFTSDPWILGAELYPDSSAADLGFRLVGGMLNGLTEYRSHTIERGNRPEQMQAQVRQQAEHAAIDAATQHALDSAETGRFQQIRKKIFQQKRQRVLDADIVRPDEMPRLDQAIEEVYGAEINEAAAEAFMAHSRQAHAEQREEIYDIFYGRNDGLLEFVPIRREQPMEADQDPTRTGSPQRSTPLLGPSPTSTPQQTPTPAPRRPNMPDIPTPTAVFPGHLQRGQTAWIDGEKVRFDGFAASREERKGVGSGRELMVVSAPYEITASNWPHGDQTLDRRWVYRLPWTQHAVTGAPPR